MEQAVLTFEQWVELYGSNYQISDKDVKELSDIHGIDAHAEIRAALYKTYLKHMELQK